SHSRCSRARVPPRLGVGEAQEFEQIALAVGRRLPCSSPAVGAPERVLAGALDRGRQVAGIEAAAHDGRVRPGPGLGQGPAHEDLVTGSSPAPWAAAFLAIWAEVDGTDGRAAAATWTRPHCLVLLLVDDGNFPALRSAWDGRLRSPLFGTHHFLKCHGLDSF